VPLHEGPYLGYLRYHLGLVIPDDDAPVLRVGGQTYVWKAGEAVLFDDTWPHGVENRSRQLRAVLVGDGLRPMPRVASLVNRAVVRWIASPTCATSRGRPPAPRRIRMLCRRPRVHRAAESRAIGASRSARRCRAPDPRFERRGR